MKNAIMVVIIAGLFATTPSMAAEWHCKNSDDAPACYVTSVQIRNGVYSRSGMKSVNKYLFVEYIDDANKPRSFQLKVGGYYVSMDSLRATEALALTALTTGLPIAWYGTSNSAWFLAIGKPDVAIIRSDDDVPSDY